MRLYACAKDAAALLSNMDKVSECIVDNGLPEDVARTFKGIASHHFQFVLVCKLVLYQAAIFVQNDARKVYVMYWFCQIKMRTWMDK